MTGRVNARTLPGRRIEHAKAAAASSSSGTEVPGALRWVPALAISLLSLLPFLPALSAGFVWDDERAFVENLAYRGLGWSELTWMWTTFSMGIYRPLTWMTYGLDYVLWGLDPFGYHLGGLLLHGANAALVYLVALGLLERGSRARERPDPRGLVVGAGVAAFLFAVHPLRVEPVAWVSGRADVLAAGFLLLVVITYLRASRAGSRRTRWLLVATAFYGLSLAAKPIGLGLPVVLVVLDIYPLRRVSVGRHEWMNGAARRVWFEKLPFIVLALLAAPLALLSKATTGAIALKLTPGRAAALAAFGMAFPMWKTLVPFGLSPLYERYPHLDASEARFVTSVVGVLAVTVLFIVLRRRWPAGLAAGVCYLALLVPTSGLIAFGPQLTADRYTYLASVPWAILIGAGAQRVWQAWRVGRVNRALAMVIATMTVALVVVLGVLTWKQTWIWRDTESLWTHALAVDPASTVAHANLGVLLLTTGRPERAIEHFRRAPYNPDAQVAWGVFLETQGRIDDAIERYRQALRWRPTHARAYSNLGIALARQGRLDEAVGAFRQAVRLEPDLAQAHNNLGYALAQQGHLDEAITHFRRALRLKPDLGDARVNLEQTLRRKGP